MQYNCIFTGGSTRGLSYVGVLKAFEKNNIQIKKYIGSSIGALMITFYAIGYSAKEIEEEVDNLNMLKLFCDFNPNIISECAFSQGKIYTKWLRDKIEKKYYGNNYKKGKMPPVCFKDLDKELYITATNLKDCSLQIFSKETTPDTEIVYALRASSAMPSLLSPVKFEDKILVDGDILHAKPIWKFMSELLNEKEDILEFRITGGNNNKVSMNPVKLINALVNTAGYIIDDEAQDVYKNHKKVNLIKIDVNNVSCTDFKFSLRQKKKIYNIGYKRFSEFLETKKCS